MLARPAVWDQTLPLTGPRQRYSLSFRNRGKRRQLEAVIGARLTYETIEGSGEGRHIFDDGVVALNNRDGLGLAIGSNEISEL